jgi:hypothetical protein
VELTHTATGRRQRCAKVHQLVHQLVLEAFVGPRPDGMESLHGLGGKLDNRYPENLRWGTSSENHLDQYRDGTMVRARLSAAIVRECRTRYAAGGVTQRELAARVQGEQEHHDLGAKR